jgi:hypothetical protein
MEWREASGELSYLAIRLLDFVAALPTWTLPPGGRVPWSANELTELGCLTHVLARGALDTERAAASMGVIDDLFLRACNQTAPGSGATEAALLEGYIAHRHTAMLTLSRQQRLADERRGTPSTMGSTHSLSWWRAEPRAFRRGDAHE